MDGINFSLPQGQTLGIDLEVNDKEFVVFVGPSGCGKSTLLRLIAGLEGMKPRTALELEGRDVYIANGCVGCHSQMIRPFRAETERYGQVRAGALGAPQERVVPHAFACHRVVAVAFGFGTERADPLRVALHAAVLGFTHPVTGKEMLFESPMPSDLVALKAALAAI